jgi:hypothetical protein
MSTNAYQTTAVTPFRSGAVVAVLRIGFIAGTLDMADNLIFNLPRGITPVMVFQYIASGLIGMRAFRLGPFAVALGVVIHYTIALTWTGLFYLMSRRVTVLRRRSVLSGLLYGVGVYLCMNFVVLPLTAVPPPRHPMTIAARVNGVLALVFCIGLTVSLLTRRHFATNKRKRVV